MLLVLPIAVCAAAPGAASKPEQCRQMLDQALQEKNPDTRKQAVIALSLAASTEPFLSLLESMLQDKDVEVRLAVISSLVDLRSRRTRAALEKAQHDDVPEVSFAATKALWGLHDPAGKQALLSILAGDTKASSSFLTAHMREGLRMMHTPKTLFLFAFAQGIGFVPLPGLGEGISSMQGLLADPGVSGRATAALLLGRQRDPETTTALRDALGDKDWSVRAAAIHSLALQNNPAFQADFASLLDDKKEAVRLRAASGYLRLEAIKSRSAHRSGRRSAAARK
ncbi:MAG TPA: HEAT repeat domain-containing protein [Bryobacteraceae bacterium]|nr:HEAT repeat domain-containing protein [Bryobacteraceae bacterium]